jgi:hypothetical protein
LRYARRSRSSKGSLACLTRNTSRANPMDNTSGAGMPSWASPGSASHSSRTSSTALSRSSRARRTCPTDGYSSSGGPSGSGACSGGMLWRRPAAWNFFPFTQAVGSFSLNCPSADRPRVSIFFRRTFTT